MDIKQHICDTLIRVRDFYLKDLGYIPVDKFDVSPMGVAKTPKEITLECAGLNKLLIKLIDGEQPKHPDPDQRKAWYASFTDADAVKSEFKQSMDALLEKIKGLDAAAFDRQVTAPWGQPVSLGYMLMLAVDHTGYHDGQINYIQALYGDDKFHWME